MRKRFGHTEQPEEAWDDLPEYGKESEDDAYCEDYEYDAYDDEHEYDAYDDEHEYDAYDDDYEDDTYYEESEDGAYYEESEDGAYYEESEDSAYYEESGDTGYYEDAYSEEPEDVAYYEEVSDEDYYVPVSRSRAAVERKKTPDRGGLLRKMGRADRIMLYFGAAVLFLAVLAGGMYIRAKAAERRMADFASVGVQLEGIEVIGDEGLLAVSDAVTAKLAAAEVLQQQEEEKEEQQKEYDEAEYSQKVTVSLKMVSVQRDLKIKFVNKETDKLISNTPFSVTVTTADKKVETWSDDDMDGIIYKKDITPGTYKVDVNALPGSDYAGYVLPTETQKTEVKKDIAYKKIDVSNEVKKESQVNLATEEQKKQELVVESSLTDTVKWVESTSVPDTYIEVPRSSITDPAPASGGTAAPSVSPGDAVQLSGPLEGIVYIGIPVSVNAAAVNAAQGSALTAGSSDGNIASVSVSGQTVTVNGVNEGTATITVQCIKDNVEKANAAWTVTVKRHPKDDTVTPLTDNEGNPLYVWENNAYRAAVHADYYREDVKLFKKGAVKHTGWQTIDGKVYFYDEAGIKVTGEQVIQGAKYNFASDGSLVTGSGTMGIDVSKHNGSIDWNAVKNAGVSYVIIRCGYRGYTQGSLIEDSKFEQNIKGATAAGLKVGVYFFSQAVNEVEAVEEASFVLDAVSGYNISYPVFLDVEYSGAARNKGRADGLDKASRTAVCKAFCATIQSGGYTAGVYANKTWLENKIDPGQLGAYKIWLAQYAAEPTYGGRYDMWQYKSTGQVSGIKGSVDLNLSYLGY